VISRDDDRGVSRTVNIEFEDVDGEWKSQYGAQEVFRKQRSGVE